MNLLHKPNKIGIVGSSGTGKTTYFERYIVNSQYDFKFVYDHEGELAGRLGVGACFSTEQLVAAIEQKQPVILFDPSQQFEGDIASGFDFFADFVFQLSKLPQYLHLRKLFSCDELQNIVGTDVANHWLCCVLETGRRYTLDWCNIAQGLHLIHNRVRLQLTEVVAFRTVEKRALDFLVQNEFPDEVRNLPDLHYILRNMRTGALTSGALKF